MSDDEHVDPGRADLRAGRDAAIGAAPEQERRELPYHYKLLLEVEIRSDGMGADGDGAKATADRLIELVKTDRNVVDVARWPNITYEGRDKPGALGYLDNQAGAAAWKGER